MDSLTQFTQGFKESMNQVYQFVSMDSFTDSSSFLQPENLLEYDHKGSSLLGQTMNIFKKADCSGHFAFTNPDCRKKEEEEEEEEEEKLDADDDYEDCEPFNIHMEYLKGDVICNGSEIWQCRLDICDGVKPEKGRERIWKQLEGEVKTVDTEEQTSDVPVHQDTN